MLSKKYKVRKGLRKNNKLYKQPQFSIITAVYNGEKYLQETIDSIVSQKFKNYEYIVIDGKSTDNTLKIIKKNLKHINFWLSEKDQGIYYAFNKGMDLSTGKYICIVNADDKLTPKALTMIDKYIRSNQNIDFIFGSVRKHWGILHGYKPEKIKYSWGFYSSHSTGFYLKKKSSQKIGLYNLKYKYHADYDYFYRMIVKNKMEGIATKKNEVVGIFRRGGFSSSIPYRKLFLEELKIRYYNNQNLFLIIILAIYKFFKHFKKITKIY